MAVAIATDYYDGIVARLLGTATPLGRLFDHATDFLFVTSSLAGAALAGSVPVVLPVLIVVAFTQYVLDSYLLYHDKELRASAMGRWNGILYFVPLVLIASSRLGLMAGVADLLTTVSLWLSYVLVLSTVGSIVDRALAPRTRRLASGEGSPDRRARSSESRSPRSNQAPSKNAPRTGARSTSQPTK